WGANAGKSPQPGEEGPQRTNKKPRRSACQKGSGPAIKGRYHNAVESQAAVPPSSAQEQARTGRMEKRAPERLSMTHQLGEVRPKYQPYFSGVVGLSLLLLMLGAGLLICGQCQKPFRTVLMLAGLTSAGAGLARLVVRAPYFGQVLEVRAYGVRFVTGKDETA